MAKLVLYRWMLLMFGCLLTIKLQAQLQLEVVTTDTARDVLPTLSLRSSFKSRQELLNYMEALPGYLQARGFLGASIDSTAEHDRTITAYLYLGKQYRWQQLKTDPKDKILLSSIGYNATDNQIADATIIAAIPQKIIYWCQENGYPFAKVKWDSIQLNNGNISGLLQIDKGPLYKLDSISLNGTVKISKTFLFRYLNIPADGIYQQSVLDKIDQKLLELPYLEQIQPWSLTLQSTGYVLSFYLQPKRSNQVDALIGLLPSNQQNNGKLLLTVDAKLLLQNAFGGGELIDLNWEQIQPRSPRLFLTFQQPYLFGSRVGADVTFQLYKKDSSFLNILGNAGVQYQLNAHQSATLLLQTQRTNLLDVDTFNIKASKRLPDIVDLTITSVGIGYQLNNTNYRYNPRKGTELSFTASAGQKTIRKNNAITNIKDGSFNYAALYDSLQLNSYQLRFRLNAAHYLPLAKRAVFKTGLQAGWLQSPGYFRNEMFQVGGYRLLRGFDEESIFANRFAVATLEYRYIVNLNSYFFGFTDVGWTHFETLQSAFSHTYLGLGAGMAFSTKQGIFNISYAVGKRNDLNLDLRQSKIHFGYLSFF